MAVVIRMIQFLWLLPVTVLFWVFYVLPVWLVFRDVQFVGWYDLFVADFVLAERDVSRWYAKLWRDWAGWSGPCVMIRRPGSNEDWNRRTQIHEYTHCLQQFRWGVFHAPAYLGVSLWIWVFQRDRHAYHDNPFEREARAAAGQQVDIPRTQWMHGPADRWPWW